MRQDYERDMDRGRRWDTDEDFGTDWRRERGGGRTGYGRGRDYGYGENMGGQREWSGRERETFGGPYAGEGRGFDRERFDRGGDYSRSGGSNFGGEFGGGFSNYGGAGNYERGDFERTRGYGGGGFGGHEREGSYGRNWGRGGSEDMGYYGQSWRGQERGTWTGSENRSDDEIRDSIYDRMDDDWEIPDNAEIDVKVDNKVVTLTGTVRSRRIKDHLTRIVNAEPGVRDVHNTINVKGRRDMKSETTGTTGTTRNK